MDARVKTFAAEARERFGFLVDAGFSEPVLDSPAGRPTVLTLTYTRPDARVDVRLVLAYMGEEGVTTTLSTAAGRSDTDTTAHTAYQMRRALEHHAAVIRAALDPEGP